jgi:hypothetical protein
VFILRTRGGNILWGLGFIVAGIGFAGNSLGLWSFRLFFNGWWTLFIIVPCLISVIQSGPRFGNCVGLGVGVVLLLSARGVIDGKLISTLVFPAVLVAVGLSILFRDSLRREARVPPRNADGTVDLFGILAGNGAAFPKEPFRGGRITAVLGGVELNLRDALITEDAVIGVTAVLGGVEIRLPPGVRVKASGLPILGGVSNKAVPAGEGAPTVHINFFCMLGGVDIV